MLGPHGRAMIAFRKSDDAFASLSSRGDATSEACTGISVMWFELTRALEKPQKLLFAVLLRDAIDNLSPRELWGELAGCPLLTYLIVTTRQ